MATPQPKYIAPVRSVAGMTFAGGNAPPTRTIPATNKSSRRAKKHADGGTAVAGIKALTCYLLRPARIHYLDHRCLKPLAIPFYFCVPLRHSAVPYEIPGLARRPGRRASHDASAGRLRLNHPRAPAVRIIPHTHGQMNGIRWLAPFFHFFSSEARPERFMGARGLQRHRHLCRTMYGKRDKDSHRFEAC